MVDSRARLALLLLALAVSAPLISAKRSDDAELVEETGRFSALGIFAVPVTPSESDKIKPQTPLLHQASHFEAFLWKTLRNLPVDEADRAIWERYKRQLADIIVGRAEFDRMEMHQQVRLQKLVALAKAEKELFELKRQAAQASADAQKAAAMVRANAVELQTLATLARRQSTAGAPNASSVKANSSNTSASTHSGASQLTYEQKVAKIKDLIDQTFDNIPVAGNDRALMEKYKHLVKHHALGVLRKEQVKANGPTPAQIRQKVETLISTSFGVAPPDAEMKPMFEKYKQRAVYQALEELELRTGVTLLTQQERDMLNEAAQQRKLLWLQEKARKEKEAQNLRLQKREQKFKVNREAEELERAERERHKRYLREKARREREYEKWLRSLPRARAAEPNEDWASKAAGKASNLRSRLGGRVTRQLTAGQRENVRASDIWRLVNEKDELASEVWQWREEKQGGVGDVVRFSPSNGAQEGSGNTVWRFAKDKEDDEEGRAGESTLWRFSQDEEVDEASEGGSTVWQFASENANEESKSEPPSSVESTQARQDKLRSEDSLNSSTSADDLDAPVPVTKEEKEMVALLDRAFSSLKGVQHERDDVVRRYKAQIQDRALMEMRQTQKNQQQQQDKKL